MITFLVVFLSSVCRLLNIKLAIIVSITFSAFIYIQHFIVIT
jgi:hypothetical protein